MVALAVAYFIAPNGGGVLQVPMFQPVANDRLDRTADGVPRGVEAGGGFLPAQASGPVGEEMTVNAAAAVFALRRWNGFDLDPAVGAIHPSHGVSEGDGDVSDGNKPEGSACGRNRGAVSRSRDTGGLLLERGRISATMCWDFPSVESATE